MTSVQDSPGNDEEEKNHIVKLYVRLPHRIVNVQEVKDLHPDIVKVTLPRQKSSRWCTIELETKESQATTIKKFKTLQIKGKAIYVSLHKNKKKTLMMRF